MGIDLKPCPFCGGTEFEVCASNGFAIMCMACKSEGPKVRKLSEVKIAWNRRTEDA